MKLFGWILSALIIYNTYGLKYSQRNKEAIIQNLLQKISDEQAQQNLPFVPFEHFHRKKGFYASYVKQNFHGDQEMAQARRILGCYDNNMFATAWVTSSLVEAFLYTDIPKPSSREITLAIQSFADHHDHNRKYNNSLMTFWEQVYNQNTSCYQCYAYNLNEIFIYAEKMPMSQIEDILKVLGLEKIAADVQQILSNKDNYLRSFHLPPDFDDTFVNIGLGSLLYGARFDLPDAWKVWSRQNTNISSVFDALIKYAYRPFSPDPNVNTIDPRTYVWIQPFLDEAKKDGKNVLLVPTWIQNIEELRKDYNRGVIMPHNVNNVDATVAANTIFGITSAVLNGLVSATIFNNSAIASIYQNTSMLLQHVIKNNMTNRPDLALLYYPSRMEFYWFVARTYDLLDSKIKKEILPHPIMTDVWKMLKSTLENVVTKDVISKAKHNYLNQTFFDDFLGNGDITKDNKTLERAEDRIFTTAMATNALLYTWMRYNSTINQYQWKTNVPATVVNTIRSSIDWLRYNVLGLNYDPWNAFFSGSWKGPTTIAQQYPGNRLEYVNGTKISNWSQLPKEAYVYGVQGYIEPEVYKTQLEQKHFGMTPKLQFPGYNSYNGFFPLWSCTAYTYSSTLIALSRGKDL